jgi:trans-aconitate methyltransferase
LDFRKIFDGIVDEFDKWRPRYCDELFSDVIEYSKLNSNKTALEIGPGTGQATDPFLNTGCLYNAIELGENLTKFMVNKYKAYKNFNIINDDFETYDFKKNKFDLVFSAAAFQWIKEEIGYPKVHDILKSKGAFALFSTPSHYGNADDPLYIEIQKIYSQYFHPKTEYTCDKKNRHMNSQEVKLYKMDILKKYGFIDIEYKEYNKTRNFTADEYVLYISTHSDHITLQEPYKSKFYSGIKEVISRFNNNITIYDTIKLYLARKNI